MSKPKAIFFDLDETLVNNRMPMQRLLMKIYQQFATQLGAENQDTFFATLTSNAKQLWGTMFASKIAPEQQFADCFARSIQATNALAENQSQLLAEAMVEQFITLSANNVSLQDGARETLETLSKLGYITGIITNGMERVQLGKIHQLRLHNQVDYVVVSAQARAHKPDIRVFQHALDQAGVAAACSWQVGDNATNDVAGAIRAGMGGVFYDPGKDRLMSAFADLRERPTHVANHLLEVVKLATGNSKKTALNIPISVAKADKTQR